ncbi:uncharacterized protein [Euwallacea fornicatus]|uniref:uncharacterized protein isoform X2 n=1 Tax=Euwallacea fornicatus TaxID=995702 RepID=UPI00338D4B8C
MKQQLWSIALLVCLLAILTGTECRTLTKRSAAVDSGPKSKRAALSPLYGFAWQTTPNPKIPTTTEDIVMFTPGKPVSLEVPDELFGSSFTLVTNLSNTIGDYMVNSAIRMQKLLESMRPFLRFVFGAKGVIIEGPTDKPIFSDPNEAKDSAS